MAFLDTEQSVHGGTVVEMFRFAVSGATSRYYTSWQEDITAFFNATYTAIPITRSAIAVGPTVDAPPLEVTMPFNADLITDLLFKTPPRKAELRIFRSHSTTPTAFNSKQIWRGLVGYAGLRGPRTAVLTVQSDMSSALDTPISSLCYQTLCNHVLYDARCTVDKTSFDQATTVSSISGNVVTVGTLSAAPDQTYKGGEIVRDSDGERRTIVDQTGTALTLMLPFRELAVTDAVTCYQGCDHLRATCNTKFSNLVNFGGFGDLRGPNIFGTGALGHGGRGQ